MQELSDERKVEAVRWDNSNTVLIGLISVVDLTLISEPLR